MMSLKTILKNFLNNVDCLESQRKLGTDPFELEFQKLKDLTEQLRQDSDYSCSHGESDVNRRKNRYKDILPYNYTRVVLSEYPGVPGSDYINANYIKNSNEGYIIIVPDLTKIRIGGIDSAILIFVKSGGSGSLAYIASQGPLPNTLVDFWRMIWECEVQVVVMACKEQESGKYKCECYWPDEGEQRQYGNITVELVKWRQVCPDFLVRTLKAFWEDEVRTICQFHYASWPDHGVPTSVQPILELVRLVRDCQASEALPVLIHCSAGCGRTGTICAIDFVWGLMRMGKLTNSFSLYEITADMRRQRIAMVQTKEQYHLVHRAVAAMFEQQLRVIDSHTYENLDQDGEPLVWKELQQENDCIYEDVCDPDSLSIEKNKSDGNKNGMSSEVSQTEKQQHKFDSNQFSQEAKSLESARPSHVYSALTNPEKFLSQCDNLSETNNIKSEQQHSENMSDFEDEEGQLSRRNSQILLKLKREESVKRLISGWNKVTEYTDTKSTPNKQSENTQKSPTARVNATFALVSSHCSQNTKNNCDGKEYHWQKSSPKITERKLSVNDTTDEVTNSSNSRTKQEDSLESKSSPESISDKFSSKEKHGKLIGKATVIRRPSIAKLKALFEKSLNIDLDTPPSVPPHRRHPLFRSHSHHLSREFRPQQERDNILNMVARKLRSPQTDRSYDTKYMYADSSMAAAAEINALSMLCSHERKALPSQKQNEMLKETEKCVNNIEPLDESVTCQKQFACTVSLKLPHSELKDNVLNSREVDSIKEVVIEKQFSTCKTELNESTQSSNVPIKSPSSKSIEVANCPDIPIKTKLLKPYGVVCHSEIVGMSASAKNHDYSEQEFVNKNNETARHEAKTSRNEVPLDSSGDYVILRTKDPAIDVAFSRHRLQESSPREGIYGTIKQSPAKKESKTEECSSHCVKPLTIPLSQMSHSYSYFSKKDEPQNNSLLSRAQETSIQEKQVTDGKGKLSHENKSDGYISEMMNNNAADYEEQKKSSVLSKDAASFSYIRASDGSASEVIKGQYTNINVTATKNIAQIESVLNHHPRGAILDLTSRKSYALDEQTLCEGNSKNESFPSQQIVYVRNTQGKLNNSNLTLATTKSKYEKIWHNQNNAYEVICKNGSDFDGKLCSSPPDGGNKHMQNVYKQTYKTQDYRLNPESVSARNLLLHSPTPKSKRNHLPRSAYKSKTSQQSPGSPTEETPQANKRYSQQGDIPMEVNNLFSKTNASHKNNDISSESPMKDQNRKSSENGNLLKDNSQNVTNFQSNQGYYSNPDSFNSPYQKSPGGNKAAPCSNTFGEKFDSPNQGSDQTFNKSFHSPISAVTSQSPKHNNYESIYGHLEQFVKRKQQKQDSDYEYIYSTSTPSSKTREFERSPLEETFVKKPISSPSHQNSKWLPVGTNVPGSENWKLSKTNSPQNYAIGPPKPPRTFSQLLPGQGNGNLSSQVKQTSTSNDGGRLIVPIASPKAINKQCVTPLPNNRKEIHLSNYARNTPATIYGRTPVDSLSSTQLHQHQVFTPAESAQVSAQQYGSQPSSCGIYGSTPISHQLSPFQPHSHNRKPSSSPYHKLKDIPVYATVREHYPGHFLPQSEEQPQVLKSANTYENIYDAQRMYYGINSPCCGDEFAGQSCQQLPMHGLRHSQSDASVYVALRSLRPLSTDSSSMKPQPPPYSEAVRPRRTVDAPNVRVKTDVPFSSHSADKRSHDDMDIRPNSVSRLKQEAHARRSMVDWDVGMTVAVDNEENPEMAQYSQVIRRPGSKKLHMREEKMQEEPPPSVPQKTRGAYQMPDSSYSKETQDKATREGSSHRGLSGTLSKAFGKLTLFTKFGSRSDQNSASGGASGEGHAKKNLEGTSKAFSFPHRLPRKPRGSKHPPKQWTQV